MLGREKRIVLDYGTDVIMGRLPRHLVHLILDHMPVRDAARTTILSRNWRTVWSEHPHLVFDKQFSRETSLDRRVNAIGDILLLHSGPVLKFYLYIPSAGFIIGRDTRIHNWLLYLSRNGIQEIRLVGCSSNPSRLHFNSVSFPGLKHLELHSCIFRPPIAVGGFRNLIFLRLVLMDFASELFASLVLDTPQLQSMILLRCTGIEHFKVNAPKLIFFQSILSSDVKSLCIHSSPDLESVNIVFPERAQMHGRVEKISLSKFLDKFQIPKIIRFNRWFLQLLDAGDVPVMLPKPLNTLTHILLHDFQFSDRHQMSCLLCLLKSSPHLTKLSIWACAEGAAAEVQDSTSYLHEPEYLNNRFETLKIVCMYDINRVVPEVHFANFILATSPMLEKILFSLNEVQNALETIQKRQQRNSQPVPPSWNMLSSKVQILSTSNEYLSPTTRRFLTRSACAMFSM